LEHERDLTNSSSERVVLPETFILLDEILKTLKNVLNNLVIHPKKIKENLELSKGLNMAEAVMVALSLSGMPRQEAHALIRKLSAEASLNKTNLLEILRHSKEVSNFLDKESLNEIVSPEDYIGTAVKQVEKVLMFAKNDRK
jgi:adenylosuccinate lyase